jgi:hypothetical protein
MAAKPGPGHAFAAAFRALQAPAVLAMIAAPHGQKL